MPMDSGNPEAQTAVVAIGRAIKQLRKTRGWTQDQLAEELGTTQPTISRWEQASRPELPDFDELEAIESVMDYPLGAILIAAGRVEVGGVEAALLADPLLGPQGRIIVIAVYRGALAAAEEAGGAR